MKWLRYVGPWAKDNLPTELTPELETEYEPLGLNGLDLDCNIVFSKIYCGNLINSTYTGELKARDGKISLTNKNFKINGVNVTFYGDIDMGQPDGYPYNVKTEFKKLDLNPLIETFVTGTYEEAKGTIDLFSLSFEGKGFTKQNLEKNFTGKLLIELSKLSLPHQIQEYKLIHIMVIPLELMGNLRSMLPGGFVVGNLKKGAEITSAIFTNKNNIDLASGIIHLNAEDGKVNLEKVDFEGGENDPVKYSRFSGYVDYNGNLDISARSNISYVRLPIEIGGTIDEPKIDKTIFIPAFLTANGAQVLDPQNVLKIFVDTGKGVLKTFESTGNAITGEANSNEEAREPIQNDKTE